MGKRLLALYDWIARVHFGLFGLGGITFMAGAIAVMSDTPAIAIALFVAGLVAIALGVGGWLRSREFPHPSAVAAAPPAVSSPSQKSSRWLPDSSDLLTITMTNADLNDALKRAKNAAKQELARDASVAFSHIELLPRPVVVFTLDSELANRRGWVYVREDSVSCYPTEYGPPSSFRPSLPPWRKDRHWPELVRDAWHRVRPFTGKAELRGEYRVIEDNESWGLWYVCFQVDPHPLFGGESRKCFGYHNGKLEMFDW